ncbi:MAG: RNA methyltransferase [Treponemataceae bacterium]|nr:MAG: RNA methyltransferase [Treponemataceae bacterium]
MKNKKNKELAVCGFAAVSSLAKTPEKITRFYFLPERSKNFAHLCKTLASLRVPYNQVASSEELEKLSGSVHHQGVVAMIRFPEILLPAKKEIDLWQQNKSTVLLLDKIGNTNNFGAIVRSAVFFGVTDIIISDTNTYSYITTSSYRSAQGAMEYVKIWEISSSSLFLKALSGKLLRMGTDVRSGESLHDCTALAQNDKGIVLVLGSEEDGVSPEVKKACDIIVTIVGADYSENSMPEKPLKIESLNVAQAASVLLYEITCRKNSSRR